MNHVTQFSKSQADVWSSNLASVEFQVLPVGLKLPCYYNEIITPYINFNFCLCLLLYKTNYHVRGLPLWLLALRVKTAGSCLMTDGACQFITVSPVSWEAPGTIWKEGYNQGLYPRPKAGWYHRYHEINVQEKKDLTFSYRKIIGKGWQKVGKGTVYEIERKERGNDSNQKQEVQLQFRCG